MNGKDDKFSFGLSNGDKSISSWIISESLVNVNVTEHVDIADEKQLLSKVSSNETPIVNTSTIEEASEITDKSEEGEGQMIETSVESGEKRKREPEESDTVIANTFKKAKTDNNACENGKWLFSVDK